MVFNFNSRLQSNGNDDDEKEEKKRREDDDTKNDKDDDTKNWMTDYFTNPKTRRKLGPQKGSRENAEESPPDYIHKGWLTNSTED